MPHKPGFRLGIYVFKDAEVIDFAAPPTACFPSLGVSIHRSIELYRSGQVIA